MEDKPPQKCKSIVQFPEKGKARCLEAVCYGNDRIAGLLDYFIHGADLEVEYKHLEEGCKVVTFTRKHKDILEKLKFNISRKTLIRYLDLLSDWGYVTSTTYSKSFTVHGDEIQKAIANPPQKPPRVKSCNVVDKSEQKVVDLPQKGCKVVDQKPSKVVEELEQKVVDLQLKVVELQQMVVNLQQKVDILSTLQPSLSPLAESNEGHNFDPYSNNSNNHNITVIYIPNESVPQTSVADATIPSVSSSEKLEQESSHIVTTTTEPEQNSSLQVEKPEEKALAEMRKTLIEIVPELPSETAEWCAKTLVQIVEFKRNKRFLETERGKSQKSQRQRQLDAAKKIIDAKVTREEFIKAYDTRNDEWWKENRGELTVVDMAAKTTKNVMRTLEVLESLDSKKSTKTQRPAQYDSILTQEEKDFRKWLVSQPQEERPKILKARREARLAAQAQA